MGSIFLSIQMPPSYPEKDVHRCICNNLKIKNFTYEYVLKSLDARQKHNIHWQIKLYVISDELSDEVEYPFPTLNIPHQKRNKRIGVIGSGPAGFFAAYVLQKAGFEVNIFERGSEVEERALQIRDFEKNNKLSEGGNYVFGEGGAGTFSDGKLTSRTKGISVYKQFVYNTYIQAGAPSEIKYMAKPHIGSNNLRVVVKNLRKQFEELGGKIFFQSFVSDFHSLGKRLKLITTDGSDEFDHLIWAPGHSAYDTYQLLISKGVRFLPKPFAIGVRVEHHQELINMWRWNTQKIEGLKSAEYIFKWKGNIGEAAYSFCMCPGGKVVQSSPFKGMSIVNGMSNYLRNSQFGNSAIVVPVDPQNLITNSLSTQAMLEYMQELESTVWNLSNSFAVPANYIRDFIQGKVSNSLPETSYSHGIFPYDFNNIFHSRISKMLRQGLKDFASKNKGFEHGIMLGLESKSSSSVQVQREINNGPCTPLSNVYVAGEGSGFAGGIVSSAVDGIKTAMHIIGSSF
jgi:uncharacterized protein